MAKPPSFQTAGPVLFIFVMQACLETLSDSWPAGKLEFRTNTRTTGARGGKAVSYTHLTLPTICSV